MSDLQIFWEKDDVLIAQVKPSGRCLAAPEKGLNQTTSLAGMTHINDDSATEPIRRKEPRSIFASQQLHPHCAGTTRVQRRVYDNDLSASDEQTRFGGEESRGRDRRIMRFAVSVNRPLCRRLRNTLGAGGRRSSAAPAISCCHSTSAEIGSIKLCRRQIGISLVELISRG